MDAKLKKDVLLQLLSAKLVEAKAYDKAALAQHRDEIKVVAAKRREYLRDLCKKSDRGLAELDGYNFRNKFPEGASCPISQALRFEKAIENVTRDMRNVFTVHDRDGSYGALLDWSAEPVNAAVC